MLCNSACVERGSQNVAVDEAGENIVVTVEAQSVVENGDFVRLQMENERLMKQVARLMAERELILEGKSAPSADAEESPGRKRSCSENDIKGAKEALAKRLQPQQPVELEKAPSNPSNSYEIGVPSSPVSRPVGTRAPDGPDGLNLDGPERQDDKVAQVALQDLYHSEPRPTENWKLLSASAAMQPLVVQFFVYLIALAGVIFVLVYPSDLVQGSDAGHRRLGGGGSAIMTAIAYSSVGAGLLGLLVYFLKQPLLLGYIIGGMMVGPIGLHLITDHEEIQTISELGLILLLFMIGLELDIRELLKMGKIVLLTGLLQFPICASLHLGVFTLLNSAGISFGNGPMSTAYIACCFGISSTMIVVKLLSEKMETDTMAGRLTIGILIFQDIWAIILLAVQPNISSPEVVGLLKTFGLMAGLIGTSMLYSKYVLPAIFAKASKSVELMLILSLGWCFFVCSIAILPFVNLSMELAALIAGVSLATFPYNAELNGKIRYIRDFFITMYFVSLGMQIPTPSIDAIAKALVCCVVVLAFRWIGICCVVSGLRGGSRLAIMSTINLSEVSEFGLVLCSIGMKLEHIDQETMTIVIWTFAILAVSASYLIGYNHTLYHKIVHVLRRLPFRKCHSDPQKAEEEKEDDEDEEERDIIILGFHRIASALIAEFEERCPEILKKIRVIDDKQMLAKPLASRGVAFTYGDISSPDVLEHAHHGPVDLVLVTIPDRVMTGVTNKRLLEVAKGVWPDAHVVVTADHDDHVTKLYNAGASYVLKFVKLSAERLTDMIAGHYRDASGGGELKAVFDLHQQQDLAQKGTTRELLKPSMSIRQASK